MAIQFKCLTCGNSLEAVDEQAGKRMNCNQCAASVTVPMPIGGRLTERRMTSTAKPDRAASSKTIATAKSVPSAAGPQKTFAGLPTVEPEPSFGFKLTHLLTDIMGTEQLAFTTRVAEGACNRVRRHLESHPNVFRTGSLLLVIERWNVNEYPPSFHGYDTKARLKGSVNGIDILETYHFGRDFTHTSRWLPYFDLIAMLSGRSSSVQQKLTAALIDSIDLAVRGRVSLWRRFRRIIW
jgi:DNA-directed RNA polymerase subunit RPC12/RpoP